MKVYESYIVETIENSVKNTVPFKSLKRATSLCELEKTACEQVTLFGIYNGSVEEIKTWKQQNKE